MMPAATNDDDFGFSGQQQQRQVNEKMKGGITAFPYFHKTTWQLLSQGAEARIWFVPAYTTITDASSSSAHVAAVCKERFPKSYRHPSLNKQLTKARIKGEVKCITKCRKNGISVPHILSVDLSGMCIFMEFIPGRTVREFLNVTLGRYSAKEQECISLSNVAVEKAASDNPGIEISLSMQQAMTVATEIGSTIAKMHNINVIHGDLTTSNIILRNLSDHDHDVLHPQLCLIDFGLALTGCTNPEEKAVDLYVLERAFISTHPGSEDLVAEILRTYKRVCSSSDSVLQRLFNVRQRGRKRECFG